jgi:hypothetical protein
VGTLTDACLCQKTEAPIYALRDGEPRAAGET